MYETFEHTADLGIRVQTDTLETLFEEAAEALCSILVVNWNEVQALQQENLRIEGSGLEDLFHDWLDELLVLFALQKMVGRRFEVRFQREGLVVGGPPEDMAPFMGQPIRLEQDVLLGTIWGERLDLARHQVGPEVKAVTYHGLKVEKLPTGWLAEVLLDL